MEFLNKKSKISEWELDILAIVYVLIGVVIGVALVVSGGVMLTSAEAQQAITNSTDIDFSLGNLASTEVSGTGGLAVVQLGQVGGWAFTGWDFRRQITVNSTYGSDLTEYQVRVDLTTSNFDYANVKADCGDIRFATVSGTPLSHYQLVCNTAGISSFWVKTDTIPASGSLDIYVYYGNAAAANSSSIRDTFSYTSEKVIGYLLNNRVNNLKIMSLEDGNSISHLGVTSELNTGEIVDYALVNTSLPLSAKKLFSSYDPDNDTDTFVPVSFASTEFIITNYYTGTGVEEFFVISPWGTTNVDIYADGVLCQTLVNVSSTVQASSTACNLAFGTTYRLVSSVPILVYYEENATLPLPLYPIDSGPWYGIASTRVAISAGMSDMVGEYYLSNSASPVAINITAQTDSTLTFAGNYGNGPAMKISSDNGTSAVQQNDADGADGTMFMPWDELGTKFGSGTNIDYIAVAAPTAVTCIVYDPTGTQFAQGTATSSNDQVYKLGFGINNTTVYMTGGWYMECDNPAYVIFQNNTQSEVNAWSYLQMRQYVYPAPTVADPAAEQGNLALSGTWESPADNNAIDLVWNGGWGDGTDGSNAFSATIANVGANASITFQIRAADSLANLPSAAYQTLGIANSGTAFTRTKAEVDALGLPLGVSGRYVQIKATLSSVDGATNPQLDDFTLSFLADDSSPSTNASGIQMYKNSVGPELSPLDWTNDLEPFFSWTVGSDNQAGLRGYCLYVGTESTGDPEFSKGLLGTSPVATTGTTCQFIIATNTIDFATAAYRGGVWLTSSTDSYYLNIKAVDNVGNVFSGASAQFEFMFDNTLPKNPSYISLPGGFISGKEATLIWPTVGAEASSDAHSGLVGVQYRIGNTGTWYGELHSGSEAADDVLINDGAYTTDPTYDYPVLIEGTNYIYMRTWDVAGNVTTSYVNGTLKINSSAPSSPQNLQVAPDTNTTNAYGFTWSPPETYIGQVNNITYCYTVNTLPGINSCTYTAAGITSLDADAYANQPGVNTFYLVARDEALNINYDTYTTVQFEYAGSAPGIPSNLDVADISIKSSANWRLALSWEAPINVGAGIASYRVYRSTTNTTCTDDFAAFGIVSTVGTTTYYADTSLLQQNYYYCVKACDSANNCSAPSATATGYPDGKFIEPAALLSGPKVSNLSTRSATINWTTDRTSDSKVAYGLASQQYYVEEAFTSNQVTDHSINLTSLLPGTTYYYVAKWTDEDGNTGITPEHTLTTNPAPLVKNVEVVRVGLDSALVRFTARGAVSVKVSYGKTTGFGGLQEIQTSPVESTYTLVIDGLDDGTIYYYRLNPVDSEGFDYEGTVLNFTTLPRPRISNIEIEEVKGAAQPTVNVTWESNTDISSIISYYPEADAAAVREVSSSELVSGSHSLTLEGLLAETVYVLSVKGADKLGNLAESDTLRFTTATDSRPPTITNLNVEGTIVSTATDSRQSAQLIVTWDTDELSTSQVEFGVGSLGGYTQRSQQDLNLTYNHLVVVSSLTPSQVYHLQVISSDSTQNEARSADTVTITPKMADSAFELVINNLLQIFGFIGL